MAARSPSSFNMHNFPASILRATQDLTSHVTPELNSWMRAQLLKHVDPNQMVAAMVRSGKPHETAALLLSLAKQQIFLGESTDEKVVKRTPIEQTLDAPHALTHFVPAGDRTVRKLMSLGSLEVALYENFLSEEEMAHIKQQSTPTLRRSKVVGPNMSNLEVPIRTSDGTFFNVGQDRVILGVEQRIAAVTGIPVEHGEGLQVLRYQDTQEYRPHFDFFEPQSPDDARKIEFGGNRTGTMILYLSDVEEGGSTYFPQLKLSIHPKKGSALWFAYMGKDGAPDMRSEHAGLPVIRGEKWIATKWLRQRPIPGLVVPTFSTSALSSSGVAAPIARATQL